jgi:hypothetical protein
MNKICIVICVRGLFFFLPSKCIEFRLPRVENGSLRECVRQVSERRIGNFLFFSNDESEIFCSFRTTNRKFFVLFFFSSECFLLCGYVYDERSVATTMNEPAVVTSENATDNIQNNVHDRNPLNLNCSTMIFRFLHFVICIVHCFFPFSGFFAGFRV